jgi:hypothetical protein
MSDPNALPIAGWYPDPENEAGDRWWNGATWSDHRRPRNAPAGWAPAPAAKKAASKKAATVAADPAAASGAPLVADPTVPAVPVPPVAPAPADRPNPYAGSVAPMFQPTPSGATGYTPYAPAYAPNYAPATPLRNPLALGGMITSLVAIICNFILFGAPGIAGAIVSFFGLRRANQLTREGVIAGNGKAMAITGIVTGLVGAFLWDLFYFSVISPISFS